MSGPAYGNKSRSIHRAVVDLAESYLDSQGIPATTKRTPTSLSDSLTDDVALAPDLSIDGVALDVTSRLRPHRLAENLESVQRTAAIRGLGVGAFVLWRGDRPIEESYVVTDLRSFARLMRGDQLPPS